MDTVLKEYVNLGVLGLNTAVLFLVLRTMWVELKAAQAARVEDLKALGHQLAATREALAAFSTDLHAALAKAETLHGKTQDMLQRRVSP